MNMGRAIESNESRYTYDSVLSDAGPAFAFGQFKHVWVYLLSTMAGGACAGLTYDKLFLEEVQVPLSGLLVCSMH